MAEVMPYPPNTISMKARRAIRRLHLDGGLFTIVKVRDRLKSYDGDPVCTIILRNGSAQGAERISRGTGSSE